MIANRSSFENPGNFGCNPGAEVLSVAQSRSFALYLGEVQGMVFEFASHSRDFMIYRASCNEVSFRIDRVTPIPVQSAHRFEMRSLSELLEKHSTQL